MLVLDSGAITRLAKRSVRSLALIEAFRAEGLWPPRVPSVVLVECLTGDDRRDASSNRFLKTCDIFEPLPERLTRRAAALRTAARRGSAVDAIVVASAEPGGSVATGDPADLRALASHAIGVSVGSI